MAPVCGDLATELLMAPPGLDAPFCPPPGLDALPFAAPPGLAAPEPALAQTVERPRPTALATTECDDAIFVPFAPELEAKDFPCLLKKCGRVVYGPIVGSPKKRAVLSYSPPQAMGSPKKRIATLKVSGASPKRSVLSYAPPQPQRSPKKRFTLSPKAKVYDATRKLNLTCQQKQPEVFVYGPTGSDFFPQQTDAAYPEEPESPKKRPKNRGTSQLQTTPPRSCVSDATRCHAGAFDASCRLLGAVSNGSELPRKPFLSTNPSNHVRGARAADITSTALNSDGIQPRGPSDSVSAVRIRNHMRTTTNTSTEDVCKSLPLESKSEDLVLALLCTKPSSDSNLLCTAPR